MTLRSILIGLLIGVCSWCMTASSWAQTFELRHQLQTGETARALTEVQMQGDSFITGTKAATQLRMQMMRTLQVGSVDSAGNAEVTVTVQQIRTQGKMENSEFDKNLTGQDLQSVMFGATQMGVRISPLGHVSGSDDTTFQKLGIQLPSSIGDTGGFEVPTFPLEAVRIGSMWTDSGQILQTTQQNNSSLTGDSVYRLTRIYSSLNGRVAVIHYKKTTDLSGLGFGSTDSNSSSGGSTASSSLRAKTSGLVIQLEGEIEFNIDRGVMVKSVQQGLWSMDMNLLMAQSGAAVSGLPAQSMAQNQNTNLKQQNMKIQISTQFQWSAAQRSQQNTPALQNLKPMVEQVPKAATGHELLP